MRTWRSIGIVAVAGALALAGCGGSEEATNANQPTSEEAVEALAPLAPVADFPKAAGLTSQEAKQRYGAELGLIPGISAMRKGVTRVSFLVLDVDGEPLDAADVVLYKINEAGSGVIGPYPAREQPFGVGPAYRSRTSSPDEKGFYVADVATDGTPVDMFAIVRQHGKLRATSVRTVGLSRDVSRPPDVGQKAVRVHTLTGADVAGDYAKITTRVPANKDMLQTDFADVLGRKPVVLLFATPQLCQSRVCGPTVDVAEQVRAKYGDRVAWVHQEIYRNNTIKDGLRPQLARWRLLSEPWIFVVGRDGRVAARFEGAVSVPELSAAVKRVAAS